MKRIAVVVRCARSPLQLSLPALMLSALASPGYAVTRYADPDAPPGGNGLSWTSPYNDLQIAINGSNAGDELRLGQGTYRLTGSRTSTFTMKNGLIIRGGYWGYGGAVPDNRSFGAFPAIISGDINADDGANFANNGENAYHVITVPAGMTSGLLDEVTILGGNASQAGGDDRTGGGVVAYGRMEFYNCRFQSNSALLGGAVRTMSGTGSCHFTRCKFLANRSTSTGGGAVFLSGKAYFTDCLFLANTASSGFGGAIIADGIGGACLLVNCAFRGNHASQGGGVYVNSIITVTNCTFVENSASTSSGAIYAGGTTYINNCILRGNSATTGPQIGWTNAIVSYSNVQGGFAGTGNIDADPYFVDLNGVDGIADTLDDNFRIGPGSPCIDAGNSNVDVDNTVGGVQGLPGTDLYGYTRRTDNPAMPDTGAGAPVVDMGAHEHFYISALHVTNIPGAFEYREGGSWFYSMGLRQALEAAARPNAGITEIRIAGQTFKPAGPSGNREATFLLPDGVKVTGGWEGFGLPGARDPNAWITTFDGDLNGNDGPSFANNGENSYHVVTVPFGADAATTILDGVRIRGARADGMFGGGIDGIGPATFQNCVIYSNYAGDSGGGGSVAPGTRFLNCRFLGNAAVAGKGGAIYSGSGSLQITNCAFSGNLAQVGGAVYASATVTNCTFTANGIFEPLEGGAVRLNGGAIYNSILIGNFAAGVPNQISGSIPVQYSAVEGGRSGPGNIASASFVDADGADNVPGTLDDDLRQASGSPTIDAASNALVPADATDLDGDGNVAEGTPLDVVRQPRFQDVQTVADTGVGPGNVVDMGAYEAAGCVTGCGPPRVITAWKSVRTHQGEGELAIVLDPAPTGNGAGGPTVETRYGGIRKILVEFDLPISIRDASLIEVFGSHTVAGFANPWQVFTPESISVVEATKLQLTFGADQLPGESCYQININPDALWESIPGDSSCRVKSLVGDTNNDGEVNAADMAATKAMMGTPAAEAPQHDINLGGSQINLGDVLFIRSRPGHLRQALCRD